MTPTTNREDGPSMMSDICCQMTKILPVLRYSIKPNEIKQFSCRIHLSITQYHILFYIINPTIHAKWWKT